MRSGRTEVVHDGWIGFSDILMTLVCGILFVGVVSWPTGMDKEKKVETAMNRLKVIRHLAGFS